VAKAGQWRLRQANVLRPPFRRDAPLHPLTNAFSEKAVNHAYAVALHLMHYNFCRVHKSLRTTPARAAGVTDRLWDVEYLVALLQADRPAPKKRDS